MGVAAPKRRSGLARRALAQQGTELKPKFAKRFAEVREQIVEATRAYVGEVQGRSFPAAEHTFKPSGLVRRRSDPPPELVDEESIPPHWQTH